MRAERVWAWSEGGAQRLLLERDVRIRIDGQALAASRATAWFETRLSDGEPVTQIAVYLEDVETPEADASISQRAKRLLVTAAIRGEVRLQTAALFRNKPPGAMTREAEIRLAAYLSDVTNNRAPIANASGVQRVPQRGPHPPLIAPEPLAPTGGLAAAPAGRPLFERSGAISFSAPDRTLITDKDENAIVLSGGVAVQYSAPSTERSLEISAENAVVFTTGAPVADLMRLGPDDVRGVYLEGGVVATDGEYTLRGPRMYYDVQNNRAVVLDGVFYTFDEKAGVPVYARAKAIRQESDSQWSAGDVELANSAFFEPQFTIGATSVTLTRTPRGGDGGRAGEGGNAGQTFVDARGVSLKYRGSVILPLPNFRGVAEKAPITEASVETRAGRPVVRTRWDFPALLGLAPPEGLDAELLLDGYTTRGVAVGADLRWSTANAEGSILGYTIFDQGEDHLSTGADINRNDELRGLLLAEQRWRLNDRWSLFLEGSYLSDEAFVDSFFPRMVDTRREFTSSIYARRLDETSLMSVELRGSVNNFAPNGYLLESQGFQVDRLPEIRYARPADTLFGGLATLSSDTRFGAIKLSLFEPSVREFGFDTRERARVAFGLLPKQSLASRLRSQGLSEDVVLRFDTRHEVSMPMRVGPVNVVPFAVGRFTAYDDSFNRFRKIVGARENDSTRLRGEAGVRMATSVTRVDDSVESRVFDLHRIRHIIEPNATVWASAESTDSASLPPIDDTVESLADGGAYRIGLKNTWQTKRPGSDGQLHSVDWLVVNTNIVRTSGDVNRESPIPRFFDSRPELSTLGEYADTSISWRLTNALTLVSNGVYDLDEDHLATASGGFLLDHGHGFSSFFEARSIDAVNSLFLDFGAAYELTPKHAVSFSTVFNADNGNVQSARATFLRRFAQWTLEVGVDVNDIRNDVGFSFVIRPAGIGAGRRTRILTREPEANSAEDRFRPVLRQFR